MLGEYGEVDFSELVGKTITRIERVYETNGTESLILETDEGERYEMLHDQDCCESVYIEDIDGPLTDIMGKVLMAEKVSNVESPPLEEDADSYTWTFYKIRTNYGSVTIRWYGSSNGYYSEEVSFRRIPPCKERSLR